MFKQANERIEWGSLPLSLSVWHTHSSSERCAIRQPTKKKNCMAFANWFGWCVVVPIEFLRNWNNWPYIWCMRRILLCVVCWSETTKKKEYMVLLKHTPNWTSYRALKRVRLGLDVFSPRCISYLFASSYCVLLLVVCPLLYRATTAEKQTAKTHTRYEKFSLNSSKSIRLYTNEPIAPAKRLMTSIKLAIKWIAQKCSLIFMRLLFRYENSMRWHRARSVVCFTFNAYKS